MRSSALTLQVLLSLFPMLLFFISLLSYFTEETLIINSLAKIKKFLPPDSFQFIEVLLKNLPYLKDPSLLSISIIFAGYSTYNTARWFLYCLIPPAYTHAYKMKIKILTFLLIIGIGLLLIAFIVFYKMIRTILIFLGNLEPVKNFNTYAISIRLFDAYGTFAIPFFIFITLLYLLIWPYKMKLKKILWGAIFSTFMMSLLWGFFPQLIYYTFKSISFYGIYASVIIFAFWMYFSNIIIILGSEINFYIQELEQSSK